MEILGPNVLFLVLYWEQVRSPLLFFGLPSFVLLASGIAMVWG